MFSIYSHPFLSKSTIITKITSTSPVKMQPYTGAWSHNLLRRPSNCRDRRCRNLCSHPVKQHFIPFTFCWTQIETLWIVVQSAHVNLPWVGTTLLPYIRSLFLSNLSPNCRKFMRFKVIKGIKMVKIASKKIKKANDKISIAET